jgi:hypothetical protein
MAQSLLQQLLSGQNFERTSTTFSLPLIIYGTAGSGKTTILKQLAKHFPELIYASFHPTTLDATLNIKQKLANPELIPDLLDEFLGGHSPPARIAQLCDPLQYHCEDKPAPHYISKFTYRFCPKSCFLINSIFHTELESRLEACCTIKTADPYVEDPVGTTIAFEPEVIQILIKHGASVHTPTEITGLSIPSVALYLSNIPQAKALNSAELFICLSRHTQAITILELDPCL